MVKGLEIFKEFFRDFQDQYVLIGGAACDIVFQEADLPFRATKDLDMVLIVEALTPEFGRRFWGFVEAGVHTDIDRFIEAFEKDPPDIKTLGVSSVTSKDIINLSKRIYYT